MLRGGVFKTFPSEQQAIQELEGKDYFMFEPLKLPLEEDNA